MKLNRQKGLTLIELLVALALAGVVMATLFGALNSAMSAYRSAGQTLRQREPLLRFVMSFSDEIRGVFPYLGGSKNFSGSSSRVEFFTLQEHWEKDEAGKIKRTGPVFTRLIYFFRDGKVYCLNLRGPAALKNAPADDSAPVFADEVKSLQFSYGYFNKETNKEQVSDSWTDSSRLPDWLLMKVDTGSDGIFERKFQLV